MRGSTETSNAAPGCVGRLPGRSLRAALSAGLLALAVLVLLPARDAAAAVATPVAVLLTPDPTSASPEIDYPGMTFSWTSVGAPFYSLLIGSAPGKSDLFNSGKLSTTSVAADLSGKPVLPDGRKLFVRLRTLGPDNKWHVKSYTIQIETLPRPSLLTPTCGTVLPGLGGTFTWDAHGWPVDSWQLKVGFTAGGKEYHDSGVRAATDPNATGPDDVPTLPGDGSIVYARLSYHTAVGGWQNADCSFQAAHVATPSLVLPACNSTLSGDTADFSWDDNGWQIEDWSLTVGRTPGTGDIFKTPNGAYGDPNVTSQHVTNLPTDGSAVIATLAFKPAVLGRFLTTSCLLSSAGPQRPIFTAPTCGGVLTGATHEFMWDPRQEVVDGWQVVVGTQPGRSDLFDSKTLPSTTTHVDATGLTRDGRTLYAELRWLHGTTWSRLACPFVSFRAQSLKADATLALQPTDTSVTPVKMAIKDRCSGSGEIRKAVGACLNQDCELPASIPSTLDLQAPLVTITTFGSVSPPSSPIPDLNGSWRFTGGFASDCHKANGSLNSAFLDTGLFTMSQTSSDASGQNLSGVIRVATVPVFPGCRFSCTAPGPGKPRSICSYDCPDAQNLHCNVSCNPKTDFCNRETKVLGFVGTDGLIDATLEFAQDLSYQCGNFGFARTTHEQKLELHTTGQLGPVLP